MNTTGQWISEGTLLLRDMRHDLIARTPKP